MNRYYQAGARSACAKYAFTLDQLGHALDFGVAGATGAYNAPEGESRWLHGATGALLGGGGAVLGERLARKALPSRAVPYRSGSEGQFEHVRHEPHPWNNVAGFGGNVLGYLGGSQLGTAAASAIHKKLNKPKSPEKKNDTARKARSEDEGKKEEV